MGVLSILMNGPDPGKRVGRIILDALDKFLCKHLKREILWALGGDHKAVVTVLASVARGQFGLLCAAE
jgi:hypothetical protein